MDLWVGERGAKKARERFLAPGVSPDAILVDDWNLSYAARNYISRKRGLAFRRVECVSTDYHPCFKWCQPAVPHFHWDVGKAVGRVVQWADHIAQGKEYRKVKLFKARLIPGG